MSDKLRLVDHTSFLNACFNGDVKRVEHGLQNGANVDGLLGTTGFMAICRYGHSQCAALLLKHGVSVDIQDEKGWTALMIACESGHSNCVELLLKHGVSVDIQDEKGWTALMIACRNGQLQCVNLLIESGRATNIINASNVEGATAVYEACRVGSARMLHLLLDAKADANIGSDTRTARNALLHHASHREDFEFRFEAELRFEAEPFPFVSSVERALTGFVLMCGGYELSRALLLRRDLLLREDYQRAHALLEYRQFVLLSVLDTDVVVDTRLHRKENGLYHEPLEQVLAYSGMLLIPQVLNIHEDGKSGRVMLTGSFEATKMAFGRLFADI